jgi:hypothetical protein
MATSALHSTDSSAHACAPAPAPRRRVPLLLAALCGCTASLMGCGAHSPAASAHGEAVYPAADGAASSDSGASVERSDSEQAEGESDAAGQDGRRFGEGQPEEPTSAAGSFEALEQVAADYELMLSQGAVDCGAAQDLVERICYLAERVCGLRGVSGADGDGDEQAEAQCQEGRARCARSEARLRSSCAGSR